MCLACRPQENIHGKEDIKKLFNLQPLADLLNTTIEKVKAISSCTGSFLHTYNNKTIELNYEQITEITNNALVVVATGIDTQIDIWAIQWPRDYIVKTLNI